MNKDAYKEYLSDFRKSLDFLGIKKSDIVYVDSDIAGIVVKAKSELEFKGKQEQFLFLDGLIDTLKAQVSEEGTLLFPVYSWDFCRGKVLIITKQKVKSEHLTIIFWIIVMILREQNILFIHLWFGEKKLICF